MVAYFLENSFGITIATFSLTALFTSLTGRLVSNACLVEFFMFYHGFYFLVSVIW